MTEASPRLIGLYLFVADMEATTAFYAALGLAVEPVSDMFARATWSGEVMLEFGTRQLTSSYDPGFREPGNLSKGTINFELASAEHVDALFHRLVALGYNGHLAPIDALWGARFAIINDPDGNQIGLHSPRNRVAEKQKEAGVSDGQGKG